MTKKDYVQRLLEIVEQGANKLTVKQLRTLISSYKGQFK